MLRTSQKFKVLPIALIAAVGVIAAPIGSASAVTKSVKLTGKATSKGNKIKLAITSTPFGKGTGKGVLVIPKETFVVKFKGGGFTLVGIGVLKRGKVSGTWKISKGTGKYKKIKGSGKFKQSKPAGTSPQTVVYTGKATY